MSILVAIDGGPNSDNVIEVGYDMATVYGDELVVIHVLTEDRFEARTGTAPGYYRDDAILDAERVVKEFTEEVLGTAKDVRIVGRVGHPADNVLKVAEQIDARYIVVGGRRRSPAGKAIFGSDTQEIMLNSHQPIVTVMGEAGEPPV